MGTGNTRRRNRHISDGWIFYERTTDRHKRGRVGIILYNDRPKVGGVVLQRIGISGLLQSRETGAAGNPPPVSHNHAPLWHSN